MSYLIGKKQKKKRPLGMLLELGMQKQGYNQQV